MIDGKLLHNPLLAWREIQGAVVIISPEESVVHELNETASFIWMQLNSAGSPAEIAALLAAEYDVAAEVARADTEEMIAHLEAKRLLLRTSAWGATHG